MQICNHHHYHYYFRSLCLPGSLSTMSTAPSSNGVFVVIPPSNASGLRSPPAILPTSLCQPPGIMQYEEPPLGAQTPRVTQPPDLRPGETFLTGEPKALGVRTTSLTTWGIGAGQGRSTHAPCRYCATLSRSVVSDSLRPYGLQLARLLCPWGFSSQEYWSGLPCPAPGDLPNPGIKPRSPALQVDSLLSQPPGQQLVDA